MTVANNTTNAYKNTVWGKAYSMTVFIEDFVAWRGQDRPKISKKSLKELLGQYIEWRGERQLEDFLPTSHRDLSEAFEYDVDTGELYHMPAERVNYFASEGAGRRFDNWIGRHDFESYDHLKSQVWEYFDIEHMTKNRAVANAVLQQICIG